MAPYTNNKLQLYKDTFDYDGGMYNVEKTDKSLQCAENVKKMMGWAVSYLLLEDKQLKRNMNMVLK